VQCHSDCQGDPSCADDCDQHANQQTLARVQALNDCVAAHCASDAGAQSCIGPGDPCNGAWSDCLADHPTCWF
jgi:hypothetical protein